MNKIKFLTLTFLFSINLNAQDVISKVLYFSSNSSSISKSSIDELISFTNEVNSIDSIVISGHTDTIGSHSSNLILSRKRINSVKNILSKHLNAKPLIISHALGESYNKTPEDMKRNVRVDIYFSSSTTINDLYKLLLPQPQEFIINPLQDTIIRTTKGTLVVIKANTFNTKITSPVTIKITEYYNKLDMIRGNLSTTSNEKILISGGMVNIEAYQDAKKLENKLNKDIRILVPTAKKDEKMKTFYGARDSSHNIDWNSNSSILDSIIMMDYSCECDTITPKYRSSNCDNILSLPEDHFDLKFNFLQEIFLSKSKKEQKTLENIELINEKITCAKKYKKAKNDSINKLESFNQPICKRYCEQKEVLKKIENSSIDEWKKSVETNINNGDSSLDLNEVKYYLFNGSQLGYMNIDKFLQDNSQRVNFTVSPNNSYTDLKLIFKEFNSILPSESLGNNFIVKNIPINRQVILFGLQYINGQARVYYQEITTNSQNTTYEMEFKSVNLDELNEIMEKLKN